MNETLKIISKRYSCRNYASKSIESDKLMAIAYAAAAAPTALNRQSLHISVVSNKELIAEIEAEGMRVMQEQEDQTAYERIKGRGGRLFYGATAVVFIATSDFPHSKIDLGIAAQTISLAATSLGIDNCHCGMVSFCFMGKKAGQFKKQLSFPSGYECSYGVLLGYGAASGIPHTPDESKLSVIN